VLSVARQKDRHRILTRFQLACVVAVRLMHLINVSVDADMPSFSTLRLDKRRPTVQSRAERRATYIIADSA
jgi:hypothetical protein